MDRETAFLGPGTEGRSLGPGLLGDRRARTRQAAQASESPGGEAASSDAVFGVYPSPASLRGSDSNPCKSGKALLGAECFLELCVLVDVSQPATLKGACVRVCVCVCVHVHARVSMWGAGEGRRGFTSWPSWARLHPRMVSRLTCHFRKRVRCDSSRRRRIWLEKEPVLTVPLLTGFLINLLRLSIM